jgi:hypothetical protein
MRSDSQFAPTRYVHFLLQTKMALAFSYRHGWRTAEFWLVNISAHRRHLSAMRFHVTTLAVSLVKLGHLLALGGVSQEFISWMQRRPPAGRATQP